jgi:hypothetical protein
VEGDVPETVNYDELGDLVMADSEEDDLVFFLQALTNGYMPRGNGLDCRESSQHSDDSSYSPGSREALQGSLGQTV